MTKTPHPERLNLRALAISLRMGTASQAQRDLLADVLEWVADGGNFHEVSGFRRPKGRPRGSRTDVAVHYAAQLHLGDSEHTFIPAGARRQEAMTIAEALKKAADKYNVSVSTLQKAWKSKHGREIVAMVRPTYGPLGSLADMEDSAN